MTNPVDALSLKELKETTRALLLEDEPLWHIPGRDAERFPWRAPGNVDRAEPGAAARRLYLPNPLHEACRTGNLSQLQAQLEEGVSVDALDGGGHSLLHFAVGFEQVSCTEELLSRGCELELRDMWGKSAADWAIQAGAEACLQLLVAEAVRRGVTGGKGQAAPLQTQCEHFYQMTDEEMGERINETTRQLDIKLAAKHERKKNRPASGVTSTILSLPKNMAALSPPGAESEDWGPPIQGMSA